MISIKRILVVGAGAIGGYVGGSLGLAGHQTVFVCRPRTATALTTHGLTIALPGRDQSIRPVIAASASEAMQTGRFDLLVLAVKRYDTAEALESLRPFARELPPILNLQNGLGAEADTVRILGDVDVIPGTVTTSVSRPEPWHLVVDRLRGIGVAGGHPDARTWVGELGRIGLNASYFPSADSMKWSKLLTNMIANPVSAILDMNPAQIFAHPGLFRLEMLQLREAMAIMRALKIGVVDLPGTPVRLLAFCARYLPLTVARPLLGKALAGGRGDKMPSFHVDLHAGSGKSEIGYLHGAVVKFGKQLGIPTPVNSLLVEQLSSMIAGDVAIESVRGRPEILLGRVD